MTISKSEYKRTTKAEFVRRLKATQNELDDARLELVNIKTKIENAEASVTPLRESLEDAKKEAESQRNKADLSQKLADERFDAIMQQDEAIAELKHQRNFTGVIAALFAAVAALALYSLAQQ